MNRTHLELTDDQHRQLNEIARRKGRSLHEVIHEAVDLFLSEVLPETPEEEGPAEPGAAKPSAPGDDPAPS